MSSSPTGNLAESLKALLGAFGVARADTRQSVVEAAERFLAEAHIQARPVELRYGVLVLEADPRSAAELEWETDRLLDHLERLDPGAVRSIRVFTSS